MIANVFRAFLSQKLEAGGSETTIYIDRVTTLTGETISTTDFADFSRGVITVNPDGDGVSSFPEYISFTAVSGLTLTGAQRGLSALSNSVVAANKRFHPVDTPVIIGFGSHNIQDILDYIDEQIGALTLGANVVSTGTAGENLTVGQLVYLKNDGKWWKCDADTVATLEGVILGICQSTTTANNTITSGVLQKGLDTNQSGLVAGTEYYASNTAGGISTSAGTTPYKIGVARSATNLYFDPNYGSLVNYSQKQAFSGSGTPSATNYFLTKYGSFGAVKQMTAGATINGATLPVPVYQNKTDNEFYACDGNDLAALKFLGFAISNGTDGNSIDVQFSGIVSGFTGLAEGEKYYLQDAVGTIGTSIGTYEVLVGVAISTTELLIQKGRRFAAGANATGGVSGNSGTITIGFRPSVIRYTAITTANPPAILRGAWANGVYRGAAVESTNGIEGTGDRVKDSGGDYFQFSVSSVTDTSFVLNWTEVGTMGDAVIIWEAEGEL